MPCTKPGCGDDYEPRTVYHRVLYRERVVVLKHLPAEVCAGCGDVRISEALLLEIESRLEGLSRRRTERPEPEP